MCTHSWTFMHRLIHTCNILTQYTHAHTYTHGSCVHMHEHVVIHACILARKVHICVCTHITCVYMRCAQSYIHAYTIIHTYRHVTHVCTTHMHTLIHTHVHAQHAHITHACTRVHTCMHINIHIHVHTHAVHTCKHL